MTFAERRLVEKETLKNKILSAATEIMIKEGYPNLSIRKIARMIGYSPGSIYHYFRDKTEIVTCLVERGYHKILARMVAIPVNREEPEKTIIASFKAYIDLVMESPLEYQAVLFNEIEEVKSQVAILSSGVSENRQTMRMLCEMIRIGVGQGRFRAADIEMTAQIIWTATFGLVARLMLEKDLSGEQRQALIEHHFEILLHGMMK